MIFMPSQDHDNKNSEKYFLKSNRLGFRLWRQDDLDIATDLWGDYEVTRLFDARGKWSREAVRKRLAEEIKTEKKYRVQYWPIFLLEIHSHVGCCGLRPYEISQGIYEIGFHIRSSLWRRGYAREAAMTVIDYAFNTLAANGLFAGHNPRNSVSRHILLQLGFRFNPQRILSPDRP